MALSNAGELSDSERRGGHSVIESIGTPVTMWSAKALNREQRREPRRIMENNGAEMLWPVSLRTRSKSCVALVRVPSIQAWSVGNFGVGVFISKSLVTILSDL